MKSWLKARLPSAARRWKTLSGRLYLHELDALTIERCEARVIAGPFAGMRYIEQANCSALAPKLLGTYERELVPALESLLERRPTDIVDIGCAEGYYAVGLAMRSPLSQVHAFDIDEAALANLRRLAALNKVTERIHMAGACSFDTLKQFDGRRVLLICDIEGAERALLDPQQAPALAGFDILVEIHDGAESNAIRNELKTRFEASHTLEFIAYAGRCANDAAHAPWLGHARNRAQAVDEQRTFGIEWGCFRAHALEAQAGQSAPVCAQAALAEGD